MHNEYEQYITEKTNALKPDIDRVKRFASSIESHNLLQHLADAGSKQTALNIKASALALRMTDRDVFALNEPALSRLTELTRSLEAVLEQVKNNPGTATAHNGLSNLGVHSGHLLEAVSALSPLELSEALRELSSSEVAKEFLEETRDKLYEVADEAMRAEIEKAKSRFNSIEVAGNETLARISAFANESESHLKKAEAAKTATEDLKGEIKRVLAAAKEAGTKVVIGSHGEVFQARAKEFKAEKDSWFRIGCIALSILVILFIASFFWGGPYGKEEFSKITVGGIISIGSRVGTFSLISGFIAFAAGNYRAAAHNEIVNRHRALCLKSYDAYSHAFNDNPEAKAVALAKITEQIFSQEPTGISKAGTTVAPTSMSDAIKLATDIKKLG